MEEIKEIESNSNNGLIEDTISHLTSFLKSALYLKNDCEKLGLFKYVKGLINGIKKRK